MTDILIALIPAVMWGSILLVSAKLGGSPYSQTLGLTIGALLFSIGAYFIVQPELSTKAVIVSFISGVFWTLGQKNQFSAADQLGVSKALPISTGMQLLGTSLFGVFVFGEWSTRTQLMIGIAALICIIIGVLFTSLKDKDEKGEEGKKSFTKGMIILLVSTVGYVAYVVIIRWFEIDGWTAILPQSVGMIVGAIILTIRHKPFDKYAIRNTITGFVWATGNIGLLLAVPRVGVATSFSFSQMGIIISTLGGIFLLGEKKSKRQIVFVIIGCLLIIAGGVLLGFTKK
ncbi:GRP family sugar transporter [Metabacillus iocasae]|uniref:Glucose uptake protein n=1 Tax=Priestia iocasae TaxID=2291674 RepID=A0ABS2QYW0_9BACI|nr:GRP family sugar transporter [Metabacillus iocasae]MBM7704681.1 glucose uptake protein [Metabacillus iocasae]